MQQPRYCPECHRTYSHVQQYCPLDGHPIYDVPAELPEFGTMLNDRYLILAQLGTGGMGAIFRAKDIRGRREVALKVLKPALVAREQAVQRFFVEARAANRLRHPNIVELFDFGVSREGYLFLAMELLPGLTLADLLRRRERLAPGEALLVALGVTEALVHAHEKGVVHRDLKPENIFLVAWDKEGYFVKVLDFGVAAVADAQCRGALGRGEVLGTPAYMSPEQVRGDIVDRRSDIYSLGIVLFEMLAGTPPFMADTPAEIMRCHLTQDLPPLPALAVSATVRRGIDGLIRAMCARRPIERLSDAAEVRARIRAVMDNLAVEDAQAVDAALFVKTLEPMRTMVPFHERETRLVDLESDEGLHFQPTILLDPASEGIAQSLPTAFFMSPSATKIRPKCPIPWTVEAQAPILRDVANLITVSLVHIELEFESLEAEGLSARDLFNPEMEAFSAQMMAIGGTVCFDSGDEVRIVFGLHSRDFPPWEGAMTAGCDLLARVERFKSATGLPVVVRVGIATDNIPERAALTASPDQLLRGSQVDVAVRLARMALPCTLIIDDATRSRLSKGFRFEELGCIRVRGRERMTRLFTLAKGDVICQP